MLLSNSMAIPFEEGGRYLPARRYFILPAIAF